MAATTARRIDWTGEKKTVEAIDLRALSWMTGCDDFRSTFARRRGSPLARDA
jgi:hypothetical protein